MDSADLTTKYKGKETAKLSAGFYQAAFYAQMSSTKIDKKMKETEQVDVFWRAAFTWMI
jgi:hypothetical protein